MLHSGEPPFEGGNLLAGLVAAAEGLPHPYGVVEDVAQRVGVEGQDFGLFPQPGYRALDEARGDGAYVAEALGNDQVRSELLEELDVQSIDASRVRHMPLDGGVYLGAGHAAPPYFAARELGELLDACGVVALVGHADEGVARPGEVDQLGAARQ